MYSSRSLFALAGSLVLLTAGCGGSNVGHSPPAINKDALVMKWEAREKIQVFQTIEFKGDKTFQLTLWELATPVNGTYSWSGDNSVNLAFQLNDETKKMSKDALAAYRQHWKEMAKAGGGQYEQQIANSSENFSDDLLDTNQNWRVGIVEGAKAELTLKSPKGLEFSFKKPS